MRNKIPINKYISYTLPDSDNIFTCRPAPSSRKKDESEDDWLERTKKRFVPENAINVQILSD